MKFVYAGFDFSTIGEVTVKWKRDYEGGEAPQRAKVTVSATVKVFERSYADNYALLRQAQAALLQPNRQLTWTNEATGEDYIDQTGNCVAANFPEEWGQYFQQLELKFQYYENLDTAGQNLLCTFVKTGSSDQLQFSNITKWSEAANTKRFSSFRSQREEVRGQLTVEGLLLGEPNLGLEDRRAALAVKVAQMRRELNAADGRLTYGGAGATATSPAMFDQVVRITSFEAGVDQAVNAVPFKFSADYTLFPDETNYATVTATAEVKDPQRGELTLQVTGKIEASTEALARAKLDTVSAAFLKAYAGTAKTQQLALDTTANLISANADGDTFTELTFNGSWRWWRAGNFVATIAPGIATGASQPLSLGNIERWEDDLKSARFDPLRPQRKRTGRTLSAAGTLAGDANLSLADRKKQLVSLAQQLTSACNVAQATLTYGSWSALVRVENFKAKVNQAETGVEWSLQAEYTLFPDEANYTTVEATAEEKDGMTGETFLSCTGKIQAANETLARAKAASVAATFCQSYGYIGTSSQQLQWDATPNLVSANTDGDTFTELVFTGQWRKWRASNQRATFTKTGNQTPVSLGNVRTWDDGYRAERFDQHRSERRHATGMVSAAGTFSVDPALKAADRRAALLKQQRALKAEVNGADGTLAYGDWAQVVRVEEFTAKINQAETGIDWNFTASYSLFPNEGGYVTCEFTADQRQDVETGDNFLTFAGEILAPNGSLARAKLAALRAATLGIYGYHVNQLVRGGSQAHEVSANGDQTATLAGEEGMETGGDVAGVSFIRLSFNEEYRQRATGTVVSSKYRIESRDDTTSGLVLTTYTGTVTATGPTPDAALAAAAARALVLGANKEGAIDSTAFLKSQQWSVDRRQLTQNNPDEFVSLLFSYEYQSKVRAGRAYAEVNTATNTDTFGSDSQSVSGFVTAYDEATATAIYQTQVRAVYAGQLIRSESTTFQRVLAEKAAITQTLPPMGSFGPQNPAPPVAMTQSLLRLEFNFTVHSPKPAGRTTARYAMNVSRDFLNLKLTTHVRGSVFAATRTAADALLTTLFAPSGGAPGVVSGQLVTSERNED
ncbi:MAG: hypothetical protein KGL39_54205, partial [Patescibacteria group bacterium]|nr:hypothetical protein [Patescibacteria group bacterium]